MSDYPVWNPPFAPSTRIEWTVLAQELQNGSLHQLDCEIDADLCLSEKVPPADMGLQKSAVTGVWFYQWHGLSKAHLLLDT